MSEILHQLLKKIFCMGDRLNDWDSVGKGLWSV